MIPARGYPVQNGAETAVVNPAAPNITEAHPAVKRAAVSQSTRPDGLHLALTGAWKIGMAPAFQTYTTTEAAAVFIDAASVTEWDSSLVNFALQAHLHASEHQYHLELALPKGAQALLTLALSVPAQQQSTARISKFAQLKHALSPVRISEQLGRETQDLLAFIGELLAAFVQTLLGKARIRRVDVLRFGYQAGPNALPIIGLTSLLVGMILGYLGAVQLQEFGAGIYVANLVTVGMLREMGALMTAVIMAGRTGAAYAAQLGTMQVNEEVDAIEILGISPMQFLVLPRVIGVILVLPLLVIYANVLGIFGGAIVAIGLGITPLQYVTQASSSLGIDHIAVGVFKGLVFAILIGIAGCRAGMASARNSEGVGRATTTAVVTGLVYLIVADATINIICQILDI